MRSEKASLLFLHLADDIRWAWLADEAEKEQYDARSSQVLAGDNDFFHSYLTSMMLE